MRIYELFNELDYLVMHHFGNFEAALATDRGTWLLGQLLENEYRVELRRWYSSAHSLNPGAMEFKCRLEQLSGEQLWPLPSAAANPRPSSF